MFCQSLGKATSSHCQYLLEMIVQKYFHLRALIYGCVQIFFLRRKISRVCNGDLVFTNDNLDELHTCIHFGLGSSFSQVRWDFSFWVYVYCVHLPIFAFRKSSRVKWPGRSIVRALREGDRVNTPDLPLLVQVTMVLHKVISVCLCKLELMTLRTEGLYLIIWHLLLYLSELLIRCTT